MLYGFVRIIQLLINKLWCFTKNICFCYQDISIISNSDKLNQININEVTITSYNTKQLLFWIAYYDVDLIINYLLSLDSTIICLQEVFCDISKSRIIKRMKLKYPNIIYNINNKAFFGLGEDSGLMILSKIPFDENKIKYNSFNNCISFDRFANKGFIIVPLEINNKMINIINTHLQSTYEYENNYKKIRNEQINQIYNCLNNDTSLLIGDLNIKSFG